MSIEKNKKIRYYRVYDIADKRTVVYIIMYRCFAVMIGTFKLDFK